MNSIYSSVSSIRALHVVSEVPQEWLERAHDGNEADKLVVGYLLALLNQMNYTSGVQQVDIRGFISALVRDPLVVAFCRAAAGLQRLEAGTLQAEVVRNHMSMSYIVKIGLFYTPQELQRMRVSAPPPFPSDAETARHPTPAVAEAPPRRLSFRGLKSISTGVADPKNRP